MGGKRRAEELSKNPPRDDWCTPEIILTRVRQVFGGQIAFDPCGNPASIVCAKTAVLLPKYATARPCGTDEVIYADGLRLVWNNGSLRRSNGYVNPPYGRKANPAWARTIWMNSKAIPLIALVPASLGAVWWDYYWAAASSVCQVRGRLQFVGAPSKADFESAVVYTGEDQVTFERTFSDIGRIIHTTYVRYTGPWGHRGKGLI